MPDFITDRDPIVVHEEKPNLHGHSPAYIEAMFTMNEIHKEYIALCEDIETNFGNTLTYLPTLQRAAEKAREFENAEKFKNMLFERENS